MCCKKNTADVIGHGLSRRCQNVVTAKPRTNRDRFATAVSAFEPPEGIPPAAALFDGFLPFKRRRCAGAVVKGYDARASSAA